MKSNLLRQLARDPQWQMLYAKAKDLSNVQLFQNHADFTVLQLNFLQWLEIYHSLECDLAYKEQYISREVINNDIRTDAYLYWKRTQKNNKTQPTKKGKTKGKVTHTEGSTLFKRKR